MISATADPKLFDGLPYLPIFCHCSCGLEAEPPFGRILGSCYKTYRLSAIAKDRTGYLTFVPSITFIIVGDNLRDDELRKGLVIRKAIEKFAKCSNQSEKGCGALLQSADDPLKMKIRAKVSVLEILVSRHAETIEDLVEKHLVQ